MARLNYNVSEDAVKLFYAHTKLTKLIDEFRDSDASVVEIQWNEGEYANTRSACASFRKNLENRKLNNIRISTRGDRVFMFKE